LIKSAYVPRIKDAMPQVDPKKLNFKNDRLYRVIDIVDEQTIKLNTGLFVKFLGVKDLCQCLFN